MPGALFWMQCIDVQDAVWSSVLAALFILLSCASSVPWRNLSPGSQQWFENPECQNSFLERHQELFKEDKAQTPIFF